MAKLTESEYRILVVFRRALREYLHWSGTAATKLGLSPQQHNLLLAVRGHAGPVPPSISEIAEWLLIRQHSAGELVNRVEAAGLVRREPDRTDQRVTRVALTDRGRELIERLSEAHLDELNRVAAQLHISEELLEQLSAEFADYLADDFAQNVSQKVHETHDSG
jgi:DNA-binding MarR family transcriptional regulator